MIVENEKHGKYGFFFFVIQLIISELEVNLFLAGNTYEN